MPIPGASCHIVHSPGEPVSYSCMWPQAKEREEVEEQFENMVRTLAKCTGGTVDLTLLEIAVVRVKVRGVDYRVGIINDFLALDVGMATP